MRYRPEIDGLRALAVVSVVLFHAGIAGFSGGYLGVDIFFVISGFLITSIILRDLDEKKFSFVQFWERRARRILPALFFVMFVTFLAGWLVFTPYDFRFLGQSVAAQSVFVSNVLFWRRAGSWEAAEEPIPLLHTWSLSVEEQFYILFPLCLVIVTWLVPRFRWALIVAAVMISLLLNVWFIEVRPTAATYFLLPFRAWELGIGALLAMWIARNRYTPATKPLAETGSLIGLALIIGSVVVSDADSAFRAVGAITSVAGTVLVIWSNASVMSRSSRAIAWRPVVFVGLISYSLYLWHVPIFVFIAYASGLGPATLPLSAKIAAIVVSVLVAYGSYRFIETPVRRQRVFASRRLLFGSSLSVIAIFAVVGLASYQGDVIKQAGESELAYISSAQDSRSARQRDCMFDRRVSEASDGTEAFCAYGDLSAAPRFIVWGDSQADSLLPVMDELAANNQVAGIHAAHSSCPPALDAQAQLDPVCAEFNEAVAAVIENQGIRSVVLAASWADYDDDLSFEGSGLIALERTVSALRDKGLDVWLVREAPRFEFIPARKLYFEASIGRDVSKIGQEYSRYLEIAAPTDDLFEDLELSGARVIDLPAILCDPELCPVTRDNVSLYRDSRRLSVTGSLLTAPAFEELFSQLSLTARPAP